ncbi:MAG: LysR family transcriptional regulator [Betaproteobacteria bacterium]|nr:LysR family transcriptional regulator [Betaproteobacteria bacterium]
MHNQRDLPASLDLLRGFEAAARHLSFTRAGAELFLTQSAVSRQVQTLEEQLGIKLFQRRTRALVLTEAGSLYYREVAKALQQLREATASVRAATNPIVRVTTAVTFAALWLVPRLADFQSRFKDVVVHVAADNAILDLERSGLDLAIRYCSAERAGEGAVMLFGEHVTPVCSPTFVRTQGRIRKTEDLLRAPLLHFDDPTGCSPWLAWNVWMETMHLRAPNSLGGLHFSHYDQVIQAAVAGNGLALGRLPLVKSLIEDGRLITPLRGKRYATLTQNRAYWLIVAPAAGKRAEVQTFVRWLREEVAASVRRGALVGE